MPGQNQENTPPLRRRPSPARRRLRPLTLLGLAVLVLAAAYLWSERLSDGPTNARIAKPPAGAPDEAGAPMQVAAGYSVGGPFSLIDQNGAAVTETDFAGRYMLIFFGYSFCPDICPVELGNITTALQVLAERDPEKAARIVPVFVTVDPARDTPDVLKSYLDQFHPRMVGLTGTPDAIAAMTEAYRIFVHLGEADDDGRYLVDHSAFTYLMGPDGAFVAMFRPAFDPEGVARSIDRLIGDRDS